MAGETKTGTSWGDDELDAIVADYFAMLEAETAGRLYVKSHHSADLIRQIGRTHGSMEFKHQNISAVLEELGMPRISGYKPMRNYQAAIFPAIDRYLTAHPDTADGISEPDVPWLPEATLFVGAPALAKEAKRPPGLEKLLRKFDPAERDARNRALGKAGEAFVLNVERENLARADRADLANKVRWIAQEDGDGAGFDILSFETSGRERLIEVKTTNGAARTPFFVTRNELETADAKPDRWQLYRVHLFSEAPRIFTVRPPLKEALRLRTETWRASFA